MAVAFYTQVKNAFKENQVNTIKNFRVVNENKQNIFDLAILHQDFHLVRNIISYLEETDSETLRTLLLKRSGTPPIIAAAQLQDSQIFELLLEQNVGYKLADLEKAKLERAKQIKRNQGWGRIGAFLKSACPSKSFADTLNIPQVLVGFGVTLSVGFLGFFTLPVAIAGLLGLVCITVANYRKLIVEQNMQKTRLDTMISLAELNNYQAQLDAYEDKTAQSLDKSERQALAKELAFLKEAMQKDKMKNIQAVSLGNKDGTSSFLRGRDKVAAGIATFGDVLCTNAGFAGLAAVLFAATAPVIWLPWVIVGVALLIMGGITVFYIKNHPRQNIELAKQREEEFETSQRRYKGFKNFMFNRGNGLLRALELTEPNITKRALLYKEYNDLFKALEKKPNQRFSDFDAKFDGLGPDAQNKILHQAVVDGNRKLFKHLIATGGGSVVSMSSDHKTLLHHAVKRGHSLMVKEMLGLSMAAQARSKKPEWAFGIDNEVDPTLSVVERQRIIAEQQKWKILYEKRSRTLKNYQELTLKSREMLLIPDTAGNLPLHYAANLRDPSLYLLLLDQPVAYDTKDLVRAAALRQTHLTSEEWWDGFNAIIESICPGNSLPEIVFSISFAAVTVGVTGLGLGIGIAALAVFCIVAVGNFYKSHVALGLKADLEKTTLAAATARSIEFRLRTIEEKIANPTPSMDDRALKAEQENLSRELVALQQQIPSFVEDAPVNTSSFIRTKDKIVTAVSSFGTFLCAYAGMLGIIELATTAFAVAMTGPIGIGLMVGAALVGLAFAGFYYKNRKQELKEFAEVREEVYNKKGEVSSTINAANQTSKRISNLLNASIGAQQNRMVQQLVQHNCPENAPAPVSAPVVSAVMGANSLPLSPTHVSSKPVLVEEPGFVANNPLP